MNTQDRLEDGIPLARRPAPLHPRQARARSPRRLRRQGRAAVLWGLALFALAQVALLIYTEYRRPELRDPAFEIKYRQLARRISACPEPPATVVFLGSSITTHGIKAGNLDRPLSQVLHRPVVAFNLGIHSSGPVSQQVYLRRLLDRGVCPDLAVIEVSPLVLDEGRPADVALFPGQRLERRELALLPRYVDNPELAAQWWTACLVPIYGHRLVLLNKWTRFLVPFGDQLLQWEGMDTSGWWPREAYEPQRHREALAWVGSHLGPRLANYKSSEPARKALVDLLDLLKERRIPALLVLMPEGPFLRSLYAPDSQARLLADLADLGRTYHFPLVNARDWLAEEQFVDSHHPNCEGAEALTDRLAREVLLPLLGRQ